MPEVAEHPPRQARCGTLASGATGLKASYEYVVHELGAAGRGRVVIAHLGNGASMAAVRDGRAVETRRGSRRRAVSDGNAPAIRSGRAAAPARDGAVRRRRHDAGIEGVRLLVPGLSADVRKLAARERNPDAALAIAMF
jgi:acetate kinase